MLNQFGDESISQEVSSFGDAPVIEAPPEQDNLTWGKAIVEGVKNIPSSAYKLGSDIASAVAHPIQTAEGVAKIIAGTTAKLVPGDQPEVEKHIEPLIDFYKERYGSVEGFKQALAKDPVGILADVATIAIPAGKAVQGAGVASKLGAVAKTGEVISKGAALVDPITAVKTGVQASTKLIPKALPSKLYQSAVKFSKVIPEAKRAKMISTALDNKIMPTFDGLQKLEVKINDLNTKVSGLIDTATESGKTIPLNALFTELKGMRKDVLKLSTEPVKDLRAINNISKQMGIANKKLKRGRLTPTEVQELKQSIYREDETLYSKITQKPIKGKTKMAIARAAKSSLENIFPEIKELNRKQGSFIELNKEIEKAASRISNRDIIGIGGPIKAGMGKSAAGPAGMAVGLASGILDMPRVKSRLAIIANQLKKKGVKINPDSAFYTLGIITPERVGMNETEGGK